MPVRHCTPYAVYFRPANGPRPGVDAAGVVAISNVIVVECRGCGYEPPRGLVPVQCPRCHGAKFSRYRIAYGLGRARGGVIQ